MKRIMAMAAFTLSVAAAFVWLTGSGIVRVKGEAVISSSGDTNGDGAIDISDPIYLLNYLFVGGADLASCSAQGGIEAAGVSFDPSGSSLTSLNVQQAILELEGRVRDLSAKNLDLEGRIQVLEQSSPATAVDIDLVDIPKGSFTMGSPLNETGRNISEVQHLVHLLKDFRMGKTEVTQAQFKKVMGFNPSRFTGCSECPVENVNWDEADDFCKKLTELNRLAGKIGPSDFYRMPTEAEWEYACRAGTTTRFSFGAATECTEESSACVVASKYMWWAGNSSGDPGTARPHPVGQKLPNAWGLFDMHGNVQEWCQDFQEEFTSEEVTDPVGSTPPYRARRSSTYLTGLSGSRSATRSASESFYRDSSWGFRIALELGE